MPKFSWGRCVRILAVLLGVLHISLISLLIFFLVFLCPVLKVRLRSMHMQFGAL